MKFFDSHAHYFDAWFNEYEGGADALLDKIFAQQVGAIVNIATNPENLRECIAQAKKYENMYVSSGIHPEDCLYIDDIDAALSEIEASICNEKLRKESKIVAIGEIGFDYHYEGYDKEKQRYCFEYQLDMAKRLGLPVIIHDRDAHGDVFETVLKYTGVKGVFHSYSGSAEMARELIKRGYMISFSGTVSFTNAKRVAQAAAAVPRERLLIETDCPYLAPHPFRGKLNHSGLLPYTARAIAEIWGCTEEEVAEITAENARRFFGLD
jgi:TatD DNase family protein